MDKTDFTYTTYISAEPEKVFNALIDPGTTKKYWQQVNLSDWKPGSRWVHRGIDKNAPIDLVGKVIEHSPPRRLVITWAFPLDELTEEKHSRVAFDIEPYQGVTRLTIVHEGLQPDSEMLRGITEGWPMVLSSMKTLLETGRALPKLWEKAA